MNYQDLRAELKAGNVRSVYLFEGAEEYVKQQLLSQLCQKLLPAGLEQMNLTDLTNPDADELIASAETLPFMADKRIVIVRDCDLLTTAKRNDDAKLDALSDYLPKVSPTACLVFYVKGKADGRKKLYQAMKKQGAIVDFSPMNDAEAASWAQRYLKTLGKLMDNTCAQKLVFTVGHDAATLKQEMEKLAAYTEDRPQIEDADIDAVCIKSLECTVFQMVDAQVAGNNERAFSLMQSLLRAGEDRFMILAMLLRQYRILYHMRCLMEERVPQSAQANLLGIPPFNVTRTQSQARRYSKERLKEAYDYLFDLEYRLKSGQSPQDGSAEAAMLALDELLKRPA